jgi:hypothetical protein
MKITSTRDYIAQLLRDAGRVELRHQIDGRWDTTWHADAEGLLTTARSKADAGNLFTSLNHVGTWRQDPLANDDVDRYARILFDLDPERPAGTASTDDELAEARTRAIGLRRHLSGHGWPIPAIARSGNGFHLQYRCALPNTAETREQLAVIYAGLAKRHGDDVVMFDRSVRNPGRICVLYGSTKRKGESTADRPHRKSAISIPFAWDQVRAHQIDKLANVYAKEPAPKPRVDRSTAADATIAKGEGLYATLDVVALFEAHGAYVQQLGGHVHGVRCPWSDEHSTKSPANGADTVIFEADDSWPGFHCKHSHCADRNIRDLIAIWPDADRYCRAPFKSKRLDSKSSGGQAHV